MRISPRYLVLLALSLAGPIGAGTLLAGVLLLIGLLLP